MEAMYVQDYDGYIMPAAVDATGKNWMRVLLPYFEGNPSVYVCPSGLAKATQNITKGDWPELKKDFRAWTYTRNVCVGGKFNFSGTYDLSRRISHWKQPSLTIVNFDSDYIGGALKWDNMSYSNGKFVGLQYPHNNRINILMLGGNVVNYSRKDMGVPTRNNGDGVPERDKKGYYVIYAAR